VLTGGHYPDQAGPPEDPACTHHLEGALASLAAGLTAGATEGAQEWAKTAIEQIGTRSEEQGAQRTQAPFWQGIMLSDCGVGEHGEAVAPTR